MSSPPFQSCFTGFHSVFFSSLSQSYTYYVSFQNYYIFHMLHHSDVHSPQRCHFSLSLAFFWCLSCQQLLITLHLTDGCLQICIQAVTILERFNKYLFSYRWMVFPTGCFLLGVIFIAAHHIQKGGGIFLVSMLNLNLLKLNI